VKDTVIVNVAMGDWYPKGQTRLVESLEILAHALDPALHPLPIGLRPAERLSAAELGMPAS
jgi:iron complex transport system substrate-binding protein